jgi:radical SAM superfamily enzyme YgiQ (UPF0313 family)
MIHLFNVNKLKIPSLALATLKVLYAQEFDDPVRIVDINLVDSLEFLELVSECDGDLFGFTVTVYNAAHVLKYCRALSEKYPTACIVLGGALVSSRRYSLYLLENHPAIDFIIRGRADDTFLEFARVTKQINPKFVEEDIGLFNVAYRLNGIPFASPDKRQSNPNFKALSPWLKEPEYLLDGYRLNSTEPLPYSTGYGCPNRCTFCIESQQQFTLYPVNRVEKEIELILSHRPKSIFVYDSTFGYTRKRAQQVMDIIAANNKGTRILAYARYKDIDRRYCEMARRANVWFVGIGLQSTNTDTCVAISRRKSDLGEFRRRVNSDFFQKISEARVSLIYGLPGEGYEDFKKSLNYALSLHSNYNLGLYRYCHYPGTQLYEEELGYESRSPEKPEIVRGPFLTEEEVVRCNVLATYYIVLQRCFPFFLMTMICLDGFDRVGIIESLIQQTFMSLPKGMQKAAREVSFANREAASLESIMPIIETVTKNPLPFAHALSTAFARASVEANVHISSKRERLLSNWLILDIRFRNLGRQKDFRDFLHRENKWAVLVKELLADRDWSIMTCLSEGIGFLRALMAICFGSRRDWCALMPFLAKLVKQRVFFETGRYMLRWIKFLESRSRKQIPRRIVLLIIERLAQVSEMSKRRTLR